MADAWVKQVLQNGARNYIATYTLNFTATSPITGYVAADPTSSGDMGVVIQGNTLYPGTHLKIVDLKYDMSSSQSLKISWDASVAQVALSVNGQGNGHRNYQKQAALSLPSGLTSPTGKLIFDTVGTPAVGDFLSIVMWLRKDIVQ